MRKSTALPLALMLGFGAAAVAEPTRVSGYEVDLFLNGKTAKCIKTRDNSTCDTYFAKDGSVKRFTPADGKIKTGTWSVDQDELLNVQWTGKKRAMKFVVMDTGEGAWQLLKGGKLKALIKGAQPGDQIK